MSRFGPWPYASSAPLPEVTDSASLSGPASARGKAVRSDGKPFAKGSHVVLYADPFVITEVTYSGSPATATDTDLVLTYKVGETTYKATFPNTFAIGRC